MSTSTVCVPVEGAECGLIVQSYLYPATPSEEDRSRKPGFSLRKWGLVGLTRNSGRSPHGSRVCDIKPFYRGAKFTAIGALIPIS